jgi:hypothetical protein
LYLFIIISIICTIDYVSWHDVLRVDHSDMTMLYFLWNSICLCNPYVSYWDEEFFLLNMSLLGYVLPHYLTPCVWVHLFRRVLNYERSHKLNTTQDVLCLCGSACYCRAVFFPQCVAFLLCFMDMSSTTNVKAGRFWWCRSSESAHIDDHSDWIFMHGHFNRNHA